MSLRSPAASSTAVSAVMRGNRKVDTKPEVLLRSAVHRQGLRFRKNQLVRAGDVAVRPDLILVGCRLAVFVDGCFWHGCPTHGNAPTTNSEYWSAKLAGNRARDDRVNLALEAAGWGVLRIWEHVPVEAAARLVGEEVARRAAVD